MMRLLTPFLLLSCLCVTRLLADEPANDPNSLQLELLLLSTQGELKPSRKAELESVQEMSSGASRFRQAGMPNCEVAYKQLNSVSRTSARRKT